MIITGVCTSCRSMKRLDTADPSVKDREEVTVKCTGNCEGRTSHKVKSLEVAE